ncbi:hypothetical protein FAVG1_02793 [Fusarium avenaceum]|nr:hypothetical protein FAVG1_02793 [Fusarium avenaceum]
MAVSEIARIAVKPGINIINPQTPDGRILASILGGVTTLAGGPRKVFWGLEVLNPSTLWILFNWESVEQQEDFKLSAPDALKEFSKICLYSEFITNINLSPSSDVLCGPITELMMIHVSKNLSQSEKEEASEKLIHLTSECFGNSQHVNKLAHGWMVQKNVPGQRLMVDAGGVFMVFISWAGYMKQKTFHETPDYQETVKTIRTLKGIIGFQSQSVNFSSTTRLEE